MGFWCILCPFNKACLSIQKGKKRSPFVIGTLKDRALLLGQTNFERNKLLLFSQRLRNSLHWNIKQYKLHHISLKNDYFSYSKSTA